MEDSLQSLVVFDDEKIIDVQIIFTLMYSFLSSIANKGFMNLDLSLLYTNLWQDEIDTTFIGLFLNLIELKCTNCSKNYILDKGLVVKMPNREVNETMLIINMIYEKQIKRVIQ
jgi:hypothetical protein